MSTFKFSNLPNWGLVPLLVLPWVSGIYISGPTRNVWPWLISAACVLALWLLRRRLSSELVALTWVLAASLNAAIGLVQYFGLALVFSAWIVGPSDAGEALGNLGQRNHFATLTSIGLVALLAWLAMLEDRGRVHEARRVPWWASALAVLLALGNAASGSRTGLLQWVLIGLLACWWFLPQRRNLLMLALQALLAYGIAVLALPWLLALATGLDSGGLIGRIESDVGCLSRKVLWSNMLTLISQKPWLGWGFGELDYAHFITLYPGARFCQILDNAHNLPLHLAVESGLPVAFSVCGLLSWLVWRAKPWRDTHPVRQMAWGVLAVIVVHSLLEYPLWYGPFQLAAGLCVAMLWTGKRAVSPPSRVVATLHVLGPIAMAAILVSVVISYHRVSQIYLPPEERSAAYRSDTLKKVRGNWFFPSQVLFAELNVTDLTPETAAYIYVLSKQVLHYSPEPRVAEKVIESAFMLGRKDEAFAYSIRYKAAFPQDYARWAKDNVVP